MRFYPQYLLILFACIGIIGLYSGDVTLILSSILIFIIMILLLLERREKRKVKFTNLS